MKSFISYVQKLVIVSTSAALLVACASKGFEGVEEVRNNLTQLQSDPELSSRAPLQIKEAEDAVRAAEKETEDKVKSKHLVTLAERKVETARAAAKARLIEDQREDLKDARADARLDARTLEADIARGKVDAALSEAEQSRSEAERARSEAEELQRQIAELNAKTTERGLVVTLGDVLFDTGKSELKSGAINELAKLAGFLNKYQDRTVVIEGHTDSVGSEESNFSLSQRRAEAVRAHLASQGIAPTRLVATGKGETTPVAGNDSASGRQLNRRVEVVIANPPAAQ